MKIRKISVSLLACVGGCLCGCSITTKNQGETGIRYGTEITFFHRAAQTAPEPAEIKSDAPSLEHWLFDPKPIEGPPAPEPTP